MSCLFSFWGLLFELDYFAKLVLVLLKVEFEIFLIKLLAFGMFKGDIASDLS